jgi:hypothetical protein
MLLFGWYAVGIACCGTRAEQSSSRPACAIETIMRGRADRRSVIGEAWCRVRHRAAYQVLLLANSFFRCEVTEHRTSPGTRCESAIFVRDYCRIHLQKTDLPPRPQLLSTLAIYIPPSSAHHSIPAHLQLIQPRLPDQADSACFARASIAVRSTPVTTPLPTLPHAFHAHLHLRSLYL